MRRSALVLSSAAAIVLTSAPTAVGHPTASFDACLRPPVAGGCGDNVTYVYRDTVVLRGRVEPDHASAIVLRRAPGDRWRRAGRVPVTDGELVWRWHTHRPDAVQDAAYRLRFAIPGHGRSDAVLAWVLFGE
jgi:hypothetical protein